MITYFPQLCRGRSGCDVLVSRWDVCVNTIQNEREIEGVAR